MTQWFKVEISLALLLQQDTTGESSVSKLKCVPLRAEVFLRPETPSLIPGLGVERFKQRGPDPLEHHAHRRVNFPTCHGDVRENI